MVKDRTKDIGGLAIGVALGVALGIALRNIALGLAMGILLGVVFFAGSSRKRTKDAKAQSQAKTLPNDRDD